MVVENTNSQAASSRAKNVHDDGHKGKASQSFQVMYGTSFSLSMFGGVGLSVKFIRFLDHEFSPRVADSIKLAATLVSGSITKFVSDVMGPLDEESNILDDILPVSVMSGSGMITLVMGSALFWNYPIVVSVGSVVTLAAYQIYSAEEKLGSNNVILVSEDVERGAHGHNLRGSFNMTEYNITEPLGALSTDDNEVIA